MAVLADDGATFITGVILPISVGWTAVWRLARPHERDQLPDRGAHPRRRATASWSWAPSTSPTHSTTWSAWCYRRSVNW